jgi:N-acetyl-gamma-glutamylphosphate reductase
MHHIDLAAFRVDRIAGVQNRTGSIWSEIALKHVHMPELAKTIETLSGGSATGLVFTPHLAPMTRGVLVTIYCRGSATTEQCLDAARRL